MTTEIIPADYGVKERKGKIITTSRHVAKIFEKRHDHVLRDIENIISSLKSEESNSLPKIGEPNQIAPDFSGTNFIKSHYKSRGKEYPEYLLTRDGFTLLAMGFTGEKALRFKMAYIQRFNEMEEQLESLRTARLEFPELTDAIKATKENPKHYHFTNEVNMINRIVLGMSAKQFREKHGITGNSIRPYLNAEQIKAIERLQKFDIGLLHTEPDYHKRKQILTEYHEKTSSIKLVTA